ESKRAQTDTHLVWKVYGRHLTRDRVYNFFFSSRRRHTRFSRDWSSDVCSSDLRQVADVPHRGADLVLATKKPAKRLGLRWGFNRSEERRVGKEWRSRGLAGE